MGYAVVVNADAGFWIHLRSLAALTWIARWECAWRSPECWDCSSYDCKNLDIQRRLRRDRYWHGWLLTMEHLRLVFLGSLIVPGLISFWPHRLAMLLAEGTHHQNSPTAGCQRRPTGLFARLVYQCSVCSIEFNWLHWFIDVHWHSIFIDTGATSSTCTSKNGWWWFPCRSIKKACALQCLISFQRDVARMLILLEVAHLFLLFPKGTFGDINYYTRKHICRVMFSWSGSIVMSKVSPPQFVFQSLNTSA